MSPFTEPEGATLLTLDDSECLLYSHVDTREELNELENVNIWEGLMWLQTNGIRSVEEICSLEFIKKLHKQMFGSVWSWGGEFRQTELNIGIDPLDITTTLYNLLEDIKCWIEFQHYSPLELSARIHHQLVKIHPFPNGNGRHSRIYTDFIREVILDLPRLTWSNTNLDEQNDERHEYISALQVADGNDYEPLIQYLKDKGNEDTPQT